MPSEEFSARSIGEEMSLQELEADLWGDAPSGTTTLIARVYSLRQRPLVELTTEDLRLLIGQHVGLPLLVPRALDVLENDPLIEGDLYPGDLLAAVLRIPHSYWTTHSHEHDRMSQVADRTVKALDPPSDSIDTELRAEAASFTRPGA